MSRGVAYALGESKLERRRNGMKLGRMTAEA